MILMEILYNLGLPGYEPMAISERNIPVIAAGYQPRPTYLPANGGYDCCECTIKCCCTITCVAIGIAAVISIISSLV